MTSPMLSASLGLTGLAGRGSGLARTLVRHGHSVAVHDPTAGRMTALVDRYAAEGAFVGSQTLADLVAAVQQPRTVFVAAPPGTGTDAVLNGLVALLDPGDLVVDAGDAHVGDTARRERALAVRGLLLVGAGVSGGPEEALQGASITVGGPADAYERLGPVLEPVADVVDGRPCCAHVGTGASGHFAVLAREAATLVGAALVVEHRALLQAVGGAPAAVAGPEEGGATDLEVADVRAQWALQAAARLGAPLTGLAEALLERRDRPAAARVEAADALGGGALTTPRLELTVDDLEAATEAAGWVAWTQAFDLVRAAGDAYGWGVDLAAVAAAWRGGRRILPTPLARVEEAYGAVPGLVTLLAAPSVAEEVSSRLEAWRRVTGAAVEAGVPAPVTTSLLGYVDGVLRGTG